MKARDRLLATAATTAVVWGAAQYGPLPKAVTKIGLSLVPQIAAWSADRQGSEKKLMMAGFGLSVLGDIGLGTAQSLQVPGFLAFLAAQGVNTAAFSKRAPFGARKAPFIAYLAVAAAYTTWVWPRIQDKTIRPAVGLYAVSIAIMAAQALTAAQSAQPASEQRRRWSRAAVGGALQFISDGILGYNFFVKKLPMGDAMVMFAYWTAQVLYAASLKPAED